MITKAQLDERLKQNPFTVLWEVIYQSIADEISHGLLLPGDKINEIQLANSLGISRTPIKSAISKLVDDGLLIKDGKRSALVSDLNVKDYFSLYEARMGLEGYAAYLAAKNASPYHLKLLKETISKIHDATHSGNYTEYRNYEKIFHLQIVASTNNKYIIHMYDYLMQDLSRYQFSLTKRARLESHSENYLLGEYRKHLRIYEAIYHGMALEAKDAVETDIVTMYKTICVISGCTILVNPPSDNEPALS